MYNTMSLRAARAMRAFALGLAVVLIVALLWFVSYKNDCISCSSGDAPALAACSSCSSCDSCDSCKKDEEPDRSISGGDASGADLDPADEPEHDYIDIDVEIDGKIVHMTVDLNSRIPSSVTFASDDESIKGSVETGNPAYDGKGLKVVINSDPNKLAAPEPVAPAVSPADAAPAPAAPVQDLSDPESPVFGNSDLPVSGSDAAPVEPMLLGADPSAPVASGKNDEEIEQNNIMNAHSTMLAPVSLLDGETFGMEGKVLALGEGKVRRDVIVAVVAPEGKTVGLLCDCLATQKTINAVAAKYPKKVIYTYTIDREFFVNLRGDSYFEVYNFNDEVQIQNGMETPDWLELSVNPIPDDDLELYRMKNQLESFHVCGTKGCLVIAKNNDILRYSWDKYAHYEI